MVLSVHAHSPHDVASVLSRPDDQTIITNDSDLLAVSNGIDQPFSYRYWFDGVPTCVMAFNERNWVIGSETGAWWTEDGGLSFEPTAGPERVTTCGGDTSPFVLMGPTGAWGSVDGQNWNPIGNETEWIAHDLEVLMDGGLLAVDENGNGWRLSNADDSEWQAISAANLWVIRSVDEFGATLVAGRQDAGMIRSFDGGSSWEDIPNSPNDIRVLALSDTVWLAASATEAVWVSTDSGQSWTLNNNGLDELAEGNGGPSDGIHYFNLRIEEDRWLLGSFEGLYWKNLADEHWNQAELDIIPRVRSLQWLQDGRLLVGAYGGGVYRGTPGQEDWHEVSKGIGWSYPKQVVTADSAGDEVWVVSGSALFYTLNGGDTWDSSPVLLSEAGDMVALHPQYPDIPQLAVGGRLLSGQSAVAVSNDSGVTWSVVTLPGTCRAKPRAVEWAEDLMVACGTEGNLYRSRDAGLHFEWIGSVGHEVHEILADTRTLLATDSGVWEWHPDDTLEPFSLVGRPITAISGSPEGTIWIGSPGIGVARVDATGQSTPLGWPDGDYVEDLAISTTGEVAVALRTGAWWSDDNGLTFHRANDYDRIDDRLQHWWMNGFGLETLEEASTGYVHIGSAGSEAHLKFTGTQVRLLGAPTAGTEIQIEVDGEISDNLYWEEGKSPGLIWGTNVDAGAHSLVLRVENGILRLDGAERWQTFQPDLPLDVDGNDDHSTRCGCNQNTQGAVMLFPAWMYLRFRRRKQAT